jgi:hypothetical protein
MTKRQGPSWGKKRLPGELPREPPRLDTQALSPAGMLGGKLPIPNGAKGQIARAISAYTQYAFLLSLHIGSIN